MTDRGYMTSIAATIDQMAPQTLAAALPEDDARREVAAAMNEGVIVNDASGEVTWFNSAACRLLDQTADELMGREPSDIALRLVRLDGTPLPRDEQPAMVTLRTGLPVRDTVIGVRSGNGNTVWLSANSKPAQRAGEPIAITVFSDITAELGSRRELEDTVRQISASVFQADLPSTDRVRIAVKSSANGTNPTITGQFGGVQQLSAHRHSFFIGSVPGNGTHAACIGSLARHTLRSAGALLNDPDAVLSHLNDAVSDEWPNTTISAVFGYVDMGGDSPAFRLACGGHALPLLVREDGVDHVGVAGPAIGAAEDQRRPATEVEARPGDRLVLYTTGIDERTGSAIDATGLGARLDRSMSLDAITETAYDVVRGDPSSNHDESVLVIGIE